jgi:1-acyl-sn-glycerol-3-phosphate acyltransferase
MTWNDAVPPVLPSAGPARRVAGVFRLVLVALATLIFFPLYLLLLPPSRLLGLRLHHAAQVAWARTGLFACGLALTVEGRRMRHGGAIVANHVSWLDIFALLAPGRAIFVAKSEVRRWPVIGFVAAACDTMFVERRATAAARQREEMRARMAGGQLLCFFPEGTSTDGLRVLPFKSTLFAALLAPELREVASVQPVTVIYEPPPGLPAALYGWWGDMGFGDHVWTIVTHSFGGRVRVIFHPERRVADFADRKALARACGDVVVEALAAARPPDVPPATPPTAS